MFSSVDKLIFPFLNSVGVDSGDTIRVPEAGNAGARRSQPGNLFIKLKARSPLLFWLYGNDDLKDNFDLT